MADDLPPAYFETVFLLEDPAVELPSAFAIITAWNPMDAKRSLRQNLAADQRLQSRFDTLEQPVFQVTGTSPDFSHQEPGWAAAVGPDVAIAIARDFGQRAFWWVVDDALWLIRCEDEARFDIGGFNARIRTMP